MGRLFGDNMGERDNSRQLGDFLPMGVALRGASTGQSPHYCKRLSHVLEAHQGTIRILHTLDPIGVAMAAAGEFDPYRD